LREWLEWPTNQFDILSTGTLLFACKGTTWARRQILRAALLATLALPHTRLILHGYVVGDNSVDKSQLQAYEQVIISNEHPLRNSTIVLVETQPKNVAALTDRFLFADPQLGENLALLGRGESIVVCGGDVTYTSWNACV
jgi:hypothetical protein